MTVLSGVISLSAKYFISLHSVPVAHVPICSIGMERAWTLNTFSRLNAACWKGREAMTLSQEPCWQTNTATLGCANKNNNNWTTLFAPLCYYYQKQPLCKYVCANRLLTLALYVHIIYIYDYICESSAVRPIATVCVCWTRNPQWQKSLWGQ